MASRTINIPATTNLDADELTSGTVPFARCEWTGPQTQGFAVNIEGGLLRLTDSVIPANSRALLPGVIEG